MAQPLAGDLDGDGTVGVDDEVWLRAIYGAELGDASYDRAADGNADGQVDHRDLALFGSAFGTTGGDPTPPRPASSSA